MQLHYRNSSSRWACGNPLGASGQTAPPMAATGHYQLDHIDIFSFDESLCWCGTSGRYITRSLSKNQILILAKGISQCKWNWYQKADKLDHMERLDSASRGAWGSFTLLFHFRPKQA
jgi:hypothetical protein